MSYSFSAVVPETGAAEDPADSPADNPHKPPRRFTHSLELPPALIGQSESRQRAYNAAYNAYTPDRSEGGEEGEEGEQGEQGEEGEQNEGVSRVEAWTKPCPNDSLDEKMASKQHPRSSAFTVAKSAGDHSKDLAGRLPFMDAIEPAMQDYLQDSCMDGMKPWMRAGRTIGLIGSLLVMLPTLSFFPVLIPFPSPSAGFWENWKFNFIAHPILNYVCSRAALELFSRCTEPSQRHRVRRIVIWIPFVTVLGCLLIHMVASFFGLYPVPYAAVTSCVPSITLSIMVASRLIPADLRTAEFWTFRNFNFVCWASWGLQFGVLMLWLLVFPVLSPGWQLVGSFMVTTMLAGVGYAQEHLGRWMGLPWYIATEVKVFILFIAFLFTAALLSQAKNKVILIGIAVQDAGKALAIFAQMCFHLVSLCEQSYDEEQGSEGGDRRACAACVASFCNVLLQPCELLTLLRQNWSSGRELQRRLREIFSRCRIQTQGGLRTTAVAVADVRLLSHFTRYMMIFALVEICEVLVPVIYIIALSLLNRPEVHPNRVYFLIFSNGNYEDAMWSNTVSFFIEAAVLLWMQIVLYRSLDFNMLSFVGIVLKSEFWYWTFSLGTCCVAWTTVLIAHTGHDLMLTRSWLVPDSVDTERL